MRRKRPSLRKTCSSKLCRPDDAGASGYPGAPSCWFESIEVPVLDETAVNRSDELYAETGIASFHSNSGAAV